VRPLAPPFLEHWVPALLRAGEFRIAVARGFVGREIFAGLERARELLRLRELGDHVAQVTAGAAAFPRVATRPERASLEAPAVGPGPVADRLANPLDELVDVHDPAS